MLKLIKNRKFLKIRHFSEKITNEIVKTNDKVNKHMEIKISENKKIIIDERLAKQLEKVNKIMPLDKLNEDSIRDIIKYKIFEDSITPTVDNLKEEIPEISGHLEFNNYINSIVDQGKQEEALLIDGLVILKKRTDILHKYGIDAHHYKNYQDRDYEVDIEEVLTKDLYAKQRVVDHYVEENKNKINDLIGYYQNRIKKASQMNRYSYLIYQNNYIERMNKLKGNLFKSILATSTLSGLLYLINPLLLVLLIPDYASIIYSCHIMNNIIDQIVLYEDKNNVIIRKFNFLGFRREVPSKLTQILDIKYVKKVKNYVINIDSPIMFISKLYRLYKGKKEDKLDNFETFHKISYSVVSCYLPADSKEQHPDTNEGLTLALLNGDIKYISEYDYSEYEDRLKSLHDAMEAYKKEYARKSHSVYYTEEEKLKWKYSKFQPNRDYDDYKYTSTFKRTDDLDGTYIDNGYR